MFLKTLSEPWKPPLQYLISFGLLEKNRHTRTIMIDAISLKCGESPTFILTSLIAGEYKPEAIFTKKLKAKSSS